VESFAVDIDPGQIVRWVIAEHKLAPSSLRTSARRLAEVKEIPRRMEYHLGDEERQDLTEVETIATLEIAPAHEREGWRLTVTVEDESGARATAEDTAVVSERSIDLGTFYNEFIRSGRGVANVVAEFEGPAAKADVNLLLRSIERNQHVGEG
jgi:hypothetical protein